ncbi:MAG: CPBP family intramembrane metalloprotease [Acidobacteriaceae bacterium]
MHESRFPADADQHTPDGLHLNPGSPDVPQSLATRIFFGADGLRAGWSLLLYAIILTVLSTLAQALAAHLQRSHSPYPRTVLTVRRALTDEYLNASAVALATLAMAAIERRRFADFGLAARRGLRRFAAGLVWGIVFLSALILVLRAAGLLIFDGRLLSAASALRFGLVWLIAFFGVSLFEETFFRGYLLFTLSRGLAGIYRVFGIRSSSFVGFWTSAVIVSFGFGLVHLSNPGESRIGIFAAGLVGIVFCLSLWRTGSLWWAIGFHAAWDWSESYLYGVADSGNMTEGHFFTTHPLGPTLFSGGLTGPEGSIWVVPILLFACIVTFLTLRKEPQIELQTPSTQPM